MSLFHALASGLIGATTLTGIHESARRVVPEAPRMDVLGMRAIVKSLRQIDQAPPQGQALQQTALAGDMVANSLYYSLVGAGRPQGALLRGAVLGLAAGLGAVFLPGPLGLGEAPSKRTPATTPWRTARWRASAPMAPPAGEKGVASRWLGKRSRSTVRL
jgi:hypothetical protein